MYLQKVISKRTFKKILTFWHLGVKKHWIPDLGSTASFVQCVQSGSVGRVYDSWEIKIMNPDPVTGLGEICTR
jgi:hypothetical protein